MTIRKGQSGRHTWVVLEEGVVIAVGFEEVLERWGCEINGQYPAQHLARSKAETLMQGRKK